MLKHICIPVSNTSKINLFMFSKIYCIIHNRWNTYIPSNWSMNSNLSSFGWRETKGCIPNTYVFFNQWLVFLPLFVRLFKVLKILSPCAYIRGKMIFHSKPSLICCFAPAKIQLPTRCCNCCCPAVKKRQTNCSTRRRNSWTSWAQMRGNMPGAEMGAGKKCIYSVGIGQYSIIQNGTASKVW